MKIHRWTGLGLAGILIIIGLTGSLLAFLAEFEHVLNPENYVSEITGAVFKPLELRDKVLQHLPEAHIDSLPLYIEHGEALHLWIELPDIAKPTKMVLTDLVVNPYTAKELSRRNTDIWPIKRNNIMAFIYRIHYSLLLGDTGIWICGLAALLWTLDCFVGFYLTLPKFISSDKSWWLRWKPAWLVRTDLSRYRLNFDLHRAFGLWTFLVLFAFAWSGVSFNLGTQIYQPVMKALFGMPFSDKSIPSSQNANSEKNISWQDAYALGKLYMGEQAIKHHFNIMRQQSLDFDLNSRTFRYTVLSDKDVNERWGATTVSLNASNGRFVSITLPTGSNLGTTLTTWITAVHTAGFWRWPIQFFIAIIGLGVMMLSITGVNIWLKKNKVKKCSQKP